MYELTGPLALTVLTELPQNPIIESSSSSSLNKFFTKSLTARVHVIQAENAHLRNPITNGKDRRSRSSNTVNYENIIKIKQTKFFKKILHY